MDGLSVLLGILTAIFLIVIFGINFWNNQSSTVSESFVDAGSLALPIQKPVSFFSSQIRAVLDPLALYTNPDGTPSTDGNDLCTLFATVRTSMTPPEAVSLSPSEISKKVEAQLVIDIPGGPLPCPLLQYPKDTATDIEWLTWLQDIPTDFGARVIFMAAYADTTLTGVANKMKDALAGNIELPEIREFFANICTPTLADPKKQAGCIPPDTLTGPQIQIAVNEILAQLVSEKDRIITSKLITDPLMTTINPHNHIINAKAAAEYLDTQKKAAETGTIKVTGTVKGVYK